MTRLAVIAPKRFQKDVIEALHEARLAHIEEFIRDEEADLDIGDPLPDGSEASDRLVRLRSIISLADIDATVERPLSQQEIEERLQSELPGLEREVQQAAEARDDVLRRLEATQEEMERLRPLEPLPLRLEDYGGYESLRVFVGRPPRNLSPELSKAIERFAYFESSGAHALFVQNDAAEKAQEVLAREGWREIELPEGEGRVDERIAALETRVQRLRQELEEARSELSRIARAHGEFLLAAEEHLSIQVEKAEAPLNFASTERTFIVDAWVPEADVPLVQRAVNEAADGVVHVEVLDSGGREVHREETPPTKYEHSKAVAPFTFLLDLFSPPSYDEIDPTIILFLVFPFFFGFMIGDLGYGVLMVALGLYLYRAVGKKSQGAASLGYALFLAGIWATLFGTFVFHDALGIPFAPHGEGLSWEGLLGIHLGIGDPLLHKLGDAGVKSMLALSILAAFVHLFVGFIFGIVNEWSHSKKHAAANVGWLFTLTALFLLALFHAPANNVSAWLIESTGLGEAVWIEDHGAHVVEAIHLEGFASMLPAYVIAPGLLILIITEGFMGVMETLGLFANVISYTRLAGVAVAKGAMAEAFNFISLEEMALHGTGLVIVVGFVLFILFQLMVFVLGLISSGIQGIRLNYVEFFLKFYEGGGKPFKPFGRLRKFTLNQ